MTAENTAAPAQAPATPVRRHKELVGVVTSAKMQKTIVVKVTRRFQHRLYDRYVRSSKKFYAHDEQGEAKLGDTVRIVESRPLSKLKRWRLAEVVQRRTRVD